MSVTYPHARALRSAGGIAAMSPPGCVVLDQRGIVRLTGPDARGLLQGLISNDVDSLTPSRAVYAALLTPQGKYLFDFLLYQGSDEILLDTETATGCGADPTPLHVPAAGAGGDRKCRRHARCAGRVRRRRRRAAGFGADRGHGTQRRCRPARRRPPPGRARRARGAAGRRGRRLHRRARPGPCPVRRLRPPPAGAGRARRHAAT